MSTHVPLGSAPSSFAITTRRPVAILMVVMAVCVFGWVSYQRLALDLMPDIAYPTLTVRTEYPGTAPEEVETLISRPLERELGIVPHLVRISSVSKAGQSDVILEFEWDTDMNDVSQDIREKVDRTRLPEDAEKPLLLRYDPSLDPILRLGLYSDADSDTDGNAGTALYELRELAEEEIRREFESVAGVAAVKVKGGLEEEIHVSLQERQMALLGLDVSAINRRLDQANVNLPGGQLREGQTEYLVRTLNEFRSLDEIGALIIANEGGADIRLHDVAHITRSHKDREILTRVNGRESVELEIYKEADANIVAVAQAVRDRLNGTPEQQAYVVELAVAEADTVTEASPTDDGAEDSEEGKAEAEEGEEGDAEDAMKARKKADAMRTIQHLRMTDFITFRLPEGTHLDVLSDQSVFIQNSITEVQRSALLGGAMAVLVLLVFLRNIVHTLIVAATIPVSVIATFAPMYLFDVSLNIMSLGGLALGVGMLVDNSIVVLESIFRCREEGDDLFTATVRGTSEVGGAVFASTLTTIAVFFPIVFVEGVAGQVFGDMALTVVFSLLASLAVALYFIPMLASRQVRREGLGVLLESKYLRLGAATRIRVALRPETPAPVTDRLRQAALVLPQLLLDLVIRLGLAVGALLAAVLKTSAILVFEVLFPVWKLLERFRWKPTRPVHEQVAAWSAETPVWHGFPDNIWPGLLDNGAPAALGGDVLRLGRWVPPRKTGRLRWPLSVLRGLLSVLLAPYLLVRFVVHTALGLVRSALLVVLLLAGALLAAVVVIVTIVTVPLVAPLLSLFQVLLNMIQRAYPVVLRAALRQRFVVVGIAGASFWLCWAHLVPALGTELIPPVHQGEFNLDLTMPVGTPLLHTAAVTATAEQVTVDLEAVERVATTVGSDGAASSAADEGEHTARITVYLQSGTPPQTEDRIIDGLRQQLRALPEVATEVSYPSLFSFKTPIELEIRGDDLYLLRRTSADAVGIIADLPGLADVRSSLQTGNPELQVVYDRERLSDYGLELRAVAELVRNKVQGRVATDFRREERNIEVLVRLRPEDRLGVNELERLIVNPTGKVPIRLSSVAQIRIAEGPSEIRRIDQQRAALVTANIQGVDLGSASLGIESAMAGLSFPPGFSFLISGQNEEMERSLDSMVFALALAIFLVYIVMASQFESLIHPFVIMFTVPLAAIGAVAALYVAHIPLSIVVFIGFIMLAGIVVNNAIVLVDYINTLRRNGMVATEAIVQAGSVRLRPILMTTMTTVLGLLPMALGLGDGAEIRTPMALTVIAGLVSSTFLTLIVIPTVYALAVREKAEA
jgi:multidrug efflux pump subunit AcrB